MTDKTQKRPLSPHLQVYKLPMLAITSILHRATGYALAVGTIMIIWMLVAAASGAGPYGVFLGFCNSLIGKIMLFGWTLSLSYHMCNGVRHMFWDMGFLFKLENARMAGYVVMAAALLLTLFIWM